MKILAVIDILRGVIVRGVAGERSKYQPISSCITDSTDPADVARALAELGVDGLYVADLDAIGGAGFNFELYAKLIKCGLPVWLDAGLSKPDAARQLAEFESDGKSIARIIAGLETLPDQVTLSEMVERVTPERLVFSLDMKSGRPMSSIAEWSENSPEDFAAMAVECGVQQMILLDLHHVGTDRGVGTESLCRQIRERWPSMDLIAGGGISGQADIRRLSTAGCDVVLIASALHDGRLGAREVKEVQGDR